MSTEAQDKNTSSNRRTLLFTSVAVVAVLAWLSLRDSEPVADIDEGKQSMPGDVREIATPTAESSRRSSPSAADVIMLRDKLSRDERIERQRELFSIYEARFRQDAPDAGWAAPAERELVEAASEPALSEFGIPESYNARCTGHMCKFVIGFKTRREAQDWSEFYPATLGGTLSAVQAVIEPTSDGTWALIMYGTRAGSHSLLSVPHALRDPMGADATAGP